jgi:hypothetical protein
MNEYSSLSRGSRINFTPVSEAQKAHHSLKMNSYERSDACIQNTIPEQYKDIRLVKGNPQKEELIRTRSPYNADVLKFKHYLHYT